MTATRRAPRPVVPVTHIVGVWASYDRENTITFHLNEFQMQPRQSKTALLSSQDGPYVSGRAALIDLYLAIKDHLAEVLAEELGTSKDDQLKLW